MKLYLVRHGDAVPGAVDGERELSQKGISDMKKVAKFLKAEGVTIPYIFHSGLKRALQTADIIAKASGPECRIIKKDSLGPQDSVIPMIEDIRPLREDAMIVGHLPHLSNLLSMLILGTPEKDITHFKKGAVVLLEKDEQNPWRIQWAVIPKIL